MPYLNFADKVARGLSVQIGSNFPAKSLSIYTKKTFFLLIQLKITKETYN